MNMKIQARRLGDSSRVTMSRLTHNILLLSFIRILSRSTHFFIFFIEHEIEIHGNVTFLNYRSPFKDFYTPLNILK